MSTSISAREALARLREGNERYVRNAGSVRPRVTQGRWSELADEQPFAIVLSCSDSPVPVELVFDCALGELFVVRVPGNIVAPPIIESVEFAVLNFGIELVVVVGHTHCAVLEATVDALQGGMEVSSSVVRDLVDRVAPAVAATRTRASSDAVGRAAMQAAMHAAMNALRHGSLARVRVVGAEHDIETGTITFVADDL
jgi:carbonic anhydrase